MTTRARTVTRAAAAVAAVGVALAGAGIGLGPATSAASSHREAPLIAMDPAVDNTDVYAFVSPDRPGYVTFLANYLPFEEPDGGPNFYPFATDAAYRIYVDSDGDALPNATFQWTFQNVDQRGGDTFLYNTGPVESFDDPDLKFKQTYTLRSSFDGAPFVTRSTGTPVAPSHVGPASMPDYARLRDQATITLDGGWRIFAGQADDPFFLDLRVFDLLYGGDLSETGQDTLAGYNVNTIALEVPFEDVALHADAGRNPVIGVWATAERDRVRVTGRSKPRGGDRVQVSRLGNPLVNEVVLPANLKDAFNAISPDQDAGVPAAVDRVTNPELPALIEAVYGIPAPPAPRDDLFEIFLTGISDRQGPVAGDLNSQLLNQDVDPGRFQPSEMLRLNLSVPVSGKPDRLGVLGGDLQGYPNGRRLTDDVVDISLQAVEGAAVTGELVDALAAGDGVDANDRAFGDTFPYVALPNVGAVNAGSDRDTGPAGPATPSDPALAPAAGLGALDEGPMGPVVLVGVILGAGAATALLASLVFHLWYRRQRGRLLAGTAAPAGPPEVPPARGVYRVDR